MSRTLARPVTYASVRSKPRPEACARAVFVHRLHVHVALARPRRCTQHVGEEGFRRGIAVQDVVLSPLLVVDHELHRDARAARPARIGRMAAVADHVARVAGGGRLGHMQGFVAGQPIISQPADAATRDGGRSMPFGQSRTGIDLCKATSYTSP